MTAEMSPCPLYLIGQGFAFRMKIRFIRTPKRQGLKREKFGCYMFCKRFIVLHEQKGKIA